MKKIILLSAIILFSLPAFSQVPTWAESMSCIFYTHCTTCHNPNGIAPFSLLTYTDATDNATAIRDRVQNRSMPPYHADVNYREYAHQKTLTQDEIDQITNWVNNGMPSGDTTLAPVPPTYTQGAVITNPDFTAVIPTYTIPILSSDMYRCFIVSNPFTVAKYVTAMEVMPGNRAAVHHAVVYADTSSFPLTLDSLDTDAGYLSFGGTGSSSAKMITGYVPGSEPYFLPSGMGILVSAGSRIIVQMHYPVTSSLMTDSTRINFIFSPTSVRPADVTPALNHIYTMTDGPLYIPANTVRTFHEQYTNSLGDATILSIAPHAHLICTSMKSYAVTPANDTIPLINIPEWDFHWQGAYYFQKPVFLPVNTTIYGEATYDNTTNNPENPNSPPQPVWEGESTTDVVLFCLPLSFSR
jgi:hypothetical protein